MPTKVTGIITQGAKDFGHVQFVGSYKIAYSNDGERWNVYQDEKQRKDKVNTNFSLGQVMHFLFLKRVNLLLNPFYLYSIILYFLSRKNENC